MDNIFLYLANEDTLLFKWQTLLGSALGVMGAFLIAVIGFLMAQVYQKYKEVREGIRLTEINLAIGINDLYDAERHLKDFLTRLNEAVIDPLSKSTNPDQYFLNETNFPPLYIHIDSSLIQARHKSYYVHNKILILIKNIRITNEIFKEMKIKYENIIEKAKFLIQRSVTPINQKKEYLANNLNFVSFVSDMTDQLQIAKRAFAETKVYNLKLLEKKRWTIWCLEGISFKFFCNKRQIEKYKSTLECLDRIDSAIKDETDRLLTDADGRANSVDKIVVGYSFSSCIKRMWKKLIGYFKK